MKLTKIFMLTAFVTILAGIASAQTHKSALLQYDKQIDGIISQMTLEEKVIENIKENYFGLWKKK